MAQGPEVGRTDAPGFDPVQALLASVRYWERGRVAYNAILAAIVMAWVAATWPHLRPAITVRGALLMAVLAATANVLYCAVYPVEMLLAAGRARAAWGRLRWVLWWAGTLLASLCANYWIADEIYPYVR